jgi:hypothetical protein
MKAYRERHREQLQAKRVRFTCECGGVYLAQNKSVHMKTLKHRIHYDPEAQPKCLISEEDIAKRKARHQCECGGVYTMQNGATHRKSKIHKDFVERQTKLTTTV